MGRTLTRSDSMLRPCVASLMSIAGVMLFSVLCAMPAHADQLALNWVDNAYNEDGYSVERKVGVNGTYQSIASLPANSTSYIDASVQDGVTYCYHLMAYNTAGNSGYSNELCATATQTSGAVQGSTISAFPGTAATGASTAAASDPPPAGSSGSGASGGGGCFIATAAYGSPLAPQVQLLRDVRDHLLLPYGLGRAFVRWYYSISPPIAEVISHSESLRTLVRATLFPVIGWAAVALWSPAAGLGLTLLPVALGALLIGRRARSR